MGDFYKNVVPVRCSVAGSFSFGETADKVLDRHEQTYLPPPKFVIFNKFFMLNVYEHIALIDDCGDHVVIINSREISMRGDEWEKRVYFHHTGYAGGASWTKAFELHKKDPTMVFFYYMHYIKIES